MSKTVDSPPFSSYPSEYSFASQAFTADPFQTAKLPRKAAYHVRYLIVGLICLGTFTNSITKFLMYQVIQGMATQTSGNQSVDIRPMMRHLRSVDESNVNTLDSIKPEVGHVEEEDVCHLANNASHSDTIAPILLIHPEFDWSSEQQDLIVGAYYIGFVVMLVPSGRLAEQYGAMGLTVLGGLSHVVLNLVGPTVARWSYMGLMATRILVGTAGGAMVPANYYLITRWVPDDEKSKAMAAMSIGGMLGNLFISFITGILCEMEDLDHGWPMVFYLAGLLHLIWLFLWCYLARSHPADHRWMTPAELSYIIHRTSLTSPRAPPSVTLRQWVRMLTSSPVVAVIYVKLTHTWFNVLFIAKISNYQTFRLGLSLKESGLYGSVCIAAQAVSVLICGILSDIATRQHGCRISKTAIRKWFECISTFGSAVFMIALTQTDCKPSMYLLFCSLANAFDGASIGGSGIVILDLTSDHASTLVSIVSTFTMCLQVVCPVLMSWIYDLGGGHLQSVTRWNVLFGLTAFFSLTGGLVFLLYGSAARKHWFGDATRPGASRLSVSANLKSEMSEYNRQNSSIFGDF